MPIYEYQCGKCGHEFEVEQRITEEPVKTCPSCRARKAKRLISQTSFVLRGGGWYSDLYSSPGAPKAAEGKQAGGGEGAGASSESGDSAKKPSGSPDKPAKGKDKPAKKGSQAAA